MERQITVVSGLAGSGKSVAIRALEDAGWYCIDNLPVSLMSSFLVELANGGVPHTHIALALDSRDSTLPQAFPQLISALEAHAHISVLFLEAREEVLVARFRETRRLHPLTFSPHRALGHQDLLSAIQEDRRLLGPIRPLATQIIDTSELSAPTLRQMLTQMVGPKSGHGESLMLKLMSFGFKYGVPADINIVLDARCFPNPHYVAHLKAHTGQHPAVKDFVLKETSVATFIQKTYELILFLYPLYQQEGKHYCGVGIGCTGGKHRSVAIVEALGEALSPHIPHLTLAHCHMANE